MMRVADYMDQALYAPGRGFYDSGGRAGRRDASFITSAEVGPLFGAVLARWIDRRWQLAGSPPEWLVVDAGAGPATLTVAMRAAVTEDHPDLAEAVRWLAVERSAAQRAGHPAGIDSVPELPDRADVIIANELLDNLAVDLLEATDAGWELVTVAPSGATTPDRGGRRIPLAHAAHHWVRTARQRLRAGGALVAFDYADTTAALATRPWTEWLRAFRDQQRVDDPFDDPGSRDITVVVPWDQLPPPATTPNQAEWLRAEGIDELVAAGARHWDARAAAPALRALRMRTRTPEAAALCDPDGLGAFWVGEWGPDATK